MDYVIIKFDDGGRVESDLARVWLDAPTGERDRITRAEEEAENHLRYDPKGGTLITDGVYPPVRILDWDVLRLYYQLYELENKIIIRGFKRAP